MMSLTISKDSANPNLSVNMSLLKVQMNKSICYDGRCEIIRLHCDFFLRPPEAQIPVY